MKKFFKKNKFLIIFFGILIILVYSFYSNVFGLTYETIDFKYGKVNAKCLNIRCGPGLNYNRVGKLYKGEYIDVFAKVGNWYIVQTDSNLVGAVSADYIDAVYDENERFSIKEKNEIQGDSGEAVGQSEVKSITEEENKSDSEYSDNLVLTTDEQEFFDLINANRENNGLDKLVIDDTLQNIARLKAEDLKENNYFSHNSEKYGNIDNMLKTFEVSYTSSAENIAGNKTLVGAVEAWMNSDSHKVNILNEKFSHTGIAVIESDTYGKIFVEVFIEE